MNNQIPQHLVRKPDDVSIPTTIGPVSTVTLQDFLNGAAMVISIAMTALDAYTRLRGGTGIRR